MELTKDNLYDIICDLENTGCLSVLNEPAFKQILQDHEDAKKWNDDGKIFAYIGEHLFNHAFCCEEYWCPCNGSTFLDALADLRDKNPKYNRDVKEIFNRKPKTDSNEDRQIVKRLEELIKNNNQYHICKIGFPNSPSKQICLPCLLNTELQEPPEGKT